MCIRDSLYTVCRWHRSQAEAPWCIEEKELLVLRDDTDAGGRDAGEPRPAGRTDTRKTCAWEAIAVFTLTWETTRARLPEWELSVHA